MVHVACMLTTQWMDEWMNDYLGGGWACMLTTQWKDEWMNDYLGGGWACMLTTHWTVSSLPPGFWIVEEPSCHTFRKLWSLS